MKNCVLFSLPSVLFQKVVFQFYFKLCINEMYLFMAATFSPIQAGREGKKLGMGRV